MPSLKRAGEDVEGSPYESNKYPRLDEHVDFHGVNRKKLAASSRTGQACDRCKLRKIRCDARAGGCSPCLQNNTECKTTDRITGRATSRGHTENLEHENTLMKVYLIELQTQLRENGLEPRPQPSAPQGHPPAPPSSFPYSMQSANGSAWDGQPANGYGASHGPQAPSHGSLLPDFRSACIGDNYLGVASENNWLSSIEGTSLALFGTKIDLAEFVPASAMSYDSFLIHAFGRTQPTQRPDLPEYEQCKIFAEWFFRSIQPFIPIVHKPHFMDLLTRIYHEGHQPNAAETVMVHMMLAIMNFQWSARNGSEESRSISNEHYHYALTFIPQLITSHKLEDIQALTLICSQLRSQPRPGAAWLFTNMVLSLAVDLGLHRSASAWKGSSAAEQDPHIIEMRKRIFWSLMILHITISGKLGRPMPLRAADFDIELPETVDDNLPGEANMTKWRKCSFRAAIQGFKIVKIQMQVYSTIYAIRTTPGQYEVNVRQIEKDLEAFSAQIPPELAGGPQTREEDRVSALYMQMSEAECQLLLHHPSLCRTTSAHAASRNMDICLDASNKLLLAAHQLKALKSLDTTWYWSTDFVAAIFTTLFVHTERQHQITSTDLQRLQHDMVVWLDVLGEVGKMLGTGPKLQNAMRNIINYSVGNISRVLTAKTASAQVTTAGSPTAPTSQTPQHPAPDAARKYYDLSYAAAPGMNGNRDTNGQYMVDTPTAHPTQNIGQHATNHQLAYSEPQASLGAYPPSSAAGYNHSAYPTEDIKPSIEAQNNVDIGQTPNHQHTPQPAMTPHHPQHQQTPTNYMTTFPHHHYQQSFQPLAGTPSNTIDAHTHFGPAAWRSFADSMMTNIGSPDYSANALMALGGGPSAPGGPRVTTTSLAEDAPAGAAGGISTAEAFGTMGMQLPLDGTQTWPLIHYSTGPAVPDGQ